MPIFKKSLYSSICLVADIGDEIFELLVVVGGELSGVGGHGVDEEGCFLGEEEVDVL